MPQVLKEEVKNRIIKSAIKVFKKDNYKKASMNEIAKFANLSVGNIYRYFKNKKALYDYIVKDIYEKITHILHKCNESEGLSSLKIENCIDDFVDLYSKDKDVFIILIDSDEDIDDNKTILNEIRNILSENLIRLMKTKKTKVTKEDEFFCKTIAIAVADGVRFIVENDGDKKILEKRLRFYLEFMKKSFMEEINNDN